MLSHYAWTLWEMSKDAVMIHFDGRALGTAFFGGWMTMKFEMYEYVRIKKNGIIGQIIDICENKNGKVYTVESSTKGERADADYPGTWPMYDCTQDDIEKEEKP